jgi:Fe-Mn family superoxide dismutase
MLALPVAANHIGDERNNNPRTPMTKKITRRQALRRVAVVGAAASTVATLSPLSVSRVLAAEPAAEPFKLPPLAYAFDALEPHIDARTMEIHHGRHHATYVANLNKAVAGQGKLAGKTVEQIIRNLDDVPESIRTTVRNNGGGHANHSLFWQTMKKGGGGQPKGALAKAIERSFGNFEKFKEALSDSAMKTFGSGWAWLALDSGELKVISTPNQDSPLMRGGFPLLGIDVWEHAYYLKYQNKRADYVAAFFNVIDWDFVNERFEKRRA